MCLIFLFVYDATTSNRIINNLIVPNKMLLINTVFILGNKPWTEVRPPVAYRTEFPWTNSTIVCRIVSVDRSGRELDRTPLTRSQIDRSSSMPFLWISAVLLNCFCCCRTNNPASSWYRWLLKWRWLMRWAQPTVQQWSVELFLSSFTTWLRCDARNCEYICV